MYCARRSIVAPASTFSLAASSRKRSGATMRTSARDLGDRDHALDAAEVVEVAVGEDHRADRLRAERLLDQSPRGGGGLLRGQRVDDDPAGLALDDRHVRDVVAAHLMDAARHLEQAVQIVELRLAPQARVHARGCFAGEERVGRRVPDDAPFALDHEAVFVRDEAALRVGHVGGVVERQRRERGVRRARGGGRGRGASARRVAASPGGSGGAACAARDAQASAAHAASQDRIACSFWPHAGLRKFGLRFSLSAATPSFDSSVP